MKRKVGVSAVKARKDEQLQYTKVGKVIEGTKISSVQETLNVFRTSLIEFASKHKARINSDPEFRQQFHKMCISVGVDPLASSKGFWADVLGVGDFYFELGVKIIQITVQTRNVNGGIIPLKELLQIIRQRSTPGTLISKEDVIRSIEKLTVLGNGLRLLMMPNNPLLVSVPMEINTDHEQIFLVAEQEGGMVSEHLMQSGFGWSSDRFQMLIRQLLYEGMVWIDSYKGENFYFFPFIALEKKEQLKG